MKKTHTALLVQLGLSTHAAEVYETLLQGGAETVAAIGKRSGTHRALVYPALKELEEVGLVSHSMRGKRTVYIPENPAKLTTMAEGIAETWRMTLPALERYYEGSEGLRPKVKFMPGKQGIVSVYDDIIETLPRGGTFYRYSSATFSRPDHKFVSPTYEEKRDAKRLERLVISREKGWIHKKPDINRHIRMIPKKLDPFDHDITLLVYGGKVAYVDYRTENAFVIEHAEIAAFHRSLFKILYKILPEPAQMLKSG